VYCERPVMLAGQPTSGWWSMFRTCRSFPVRCWTEMSGAMQLSNTLSTSTLFSGRSETPSKSSQLVLSVISFTKWTGHDIVFTARFYNEWHIVDVNISHLALLMLLHYLVKFNDVEQLAGFCWSGYYKNFFASHNRTNMVLIAIFLIITCR